MPLMQPIIYNYFVWDLHFMRRLRNPFPTFLRANDFARTQMPIKFKMWINNLRNICVICFRGMNCYIDSVTGRKKTLFMSLLIRWKCHIVTNGLIKNRLYFFVLFQLTALQAHTMAPMNLFCTRFLKSLLVKDDATPKPREPQSDDDADEQMHSDDDWNVCMCKEKPWPMVNELLYSNTSHVFLFSRE